MPSSTFLEEESNKINLLIAAHGNPNIPQEHGETLLMQAVTHNNIPAVRALTKYPKTNLNLRKNDGHTALDEAILANNIELVSILLMAGALVRNTTPLLGFFHKNEAGLKKLALLIWAASEERYKFDIHFLRAATTPFNFAKIRAYMPPVFIKTALTHVLNKDSPYVPAVEKLPDHPLIAAVLQGKDETVLKLLAEDKTILEWVSSNNRTALEEAVYHDKLDMVCLLLRHGALIYAPQILFDFLQKYDQNLPEVLFCCTKLNEHLNKAKTSLAQLYRERAQLFFSNQVRAFPLELPVDEFLSYCSQEQFIALSHALRNRDVGLYNKEMLEKLLNRPFPYSVLKARDLKNEHSSPKLYIITDKMIGRGWNGSVFSCYDPSIGEFLIAKTQRMPPKSYSDIVSIWATESRALQKVGRLSSLFRWEEHGEDQLIIVAAYYPHLNLKNAMQKMTRVSLSSCIDIAIRLLQEGQYFHEQGILNPDIKPDNITINLNDKTVAVVDLGALQNPHSPTDAIDENYRDELSRRGRLELGKREYVAPELYHRDTIVFSSKTTVYSFGLVLRDVFNNMLSARKHPFYPFFEAQCKRIISEMTHLDLNRRITLINAIQQFQKLQQQCFYQRPTVIGIDIHQFEARSAEQQEKFFAELQSADVVNIHDKEPNPNIAKHLEFRRKIQNHGIWAGSQPIINPSHVEEMEGAGLSNSSGTVSLRSYKRL